MYLEHTNWKGSLLSFISFKSFDKAKVKLSSLNLVNSHSLSSTGAIPNANSSSQLNITQPDSLPWIVVHADTKKSMDIICNAFFISSSYTTLDKPQKYRYDNRLTNTSFKRFKGLSLVPNPNKIYRSIWASYGALRYLLVLVSNGYILRREWWNFY